MPLAIDDWMFLGAIVVLALAGPADALLTLGLIIAAAYLAYNARSILFRLVGIAIIAVYATVTLDTFLNRLAFASWQDAELPRADPATPFPASVWVTLAECHQDCSRFYRASAKFWRTGDRILSLLFTEGVEFVEVGTDPIIRWTRLVNDERCWDEGDLIVHWSEWRDMKAFGRSQAICGIGEPVEKSTARYRLTNEYVELDFLPGEPLHRLSLIDQRTGAEIEHAFNADVHVPRLPPVLNLFQRLQGNAASGLWSAVPLIAIDKPPRDRLQSLALIWKVYHGAMRMDHLIRTYGISAEWLLRSLRSDDPVMVRDILYFACHSREQAPAAFFRELDAIAASDDRAGHQPAKAMKEWCRPAEN